MRGPLACLIVAAACSRGGGGSDHSGRARVLAKLPAASIAVFAADGHALAHPRFHPIVDVLRPVIPSSFDCVVDVVLASEHVAIAWTRDHGVAIAIDTHVPVKCHALSRVDDVWIGTIGGAIEKGRGDTVLATPELERTRPYLLHSPVAFVAATAVGDVLVTAQPDPFEAWLAIDTSDALVATAESTLRDRIAQLARDPTTAPFAKRIAIHRDGHQIIAQLGEVAADLALAVKTLVRGQRAKPSIAAFACPPKLVGIPCVDGTHFEALQLEALFQPLRGAHVSPQVSAGEVTGMRFDAPVPELGLVAGDVIAGIDGRTVTTRQSFVAMVDPAAVRNAHRTTLVVRRGTTEAVFSLTELGP